MSPYARPSTMPIPPLAFGCYGLALASCGMSGYFGFNLGDTLAASIVFLLIAVAADAFKVGASIAFARLLSRRSWWAALALLFVVGTTALSVVGGLGFMSDQRARSSHSNETKIAEVRRLESEVRRLETERDQLGPRLPTTADADAALAAMRLDRRWQSTQRCTNATVDASRRFCAEYAQAQATRTNAERFFEINADIRALNLEISDKNAEIEAGGTETQNEAIGEILNISADHVDRIITIIFIVVIEGGATLGVALLARREQLNPVPVKPRTVSRPAEHPEPIPETTTDQGNNHAPPRALEPPRGDDAPMPLAIPTDVSATLDALKRLARERKTSSLDGIKRTSQAVAEASGKAASTVVRHFDRLAETGLIEIDRTERTAVIRIKQ